MCDMGGGGGGGFGGGGGGGGGFGGGGGLGLDLNLGGFDYSGIPNLNLEGGLNIPSGSETIDSFARTRGNAFADQYDQTRSQDAITRGYFANARKSGIAEDVNTSLQSVLNNEATRKETARNNYEASIKSKYPNYSSYMPPSAEDNPLDMSAINEGIVDSVDDGTRLADIGGARRFVGRLAPKLFGGRNVRPLDRFRTQRRFKRGNEQSGGQSGGSPLSGLFGFNNSYRRFGE